MIDERRRLLGMHWALPVFPSPKKNCIGHRGRLRLSHLLRPGACDMKRRSPVLGIIDAIDASRQELTVMGSLFLVISFVRLLNLHLIVRAFCLMEDASSLLIVQLCNLCAFWKF
jgi:hypothetical protein